MRTQEENLNAGPGLPAVLMTSRRSSFLCLPRDYAAPRGHCRPPLALRRHETSFPMGCSTSAMRQMVFRRPMLWNWRIRAFSPAPLLAVEKQKSLPPIPHTSAWFHCSSPSSATETARPCCGERRRSTEWRRRRRQRRRRRRRRPACAGARDGRAGEEDLSSRVHACSRPDSCTRYIRA